MSHFWTDFLAQNPSLGSLSAQGWIAAPTPTHTELCWTPLLSQQLIQVAGSDAQKFLQGQLTCDLRQLDQNLSLLGAHCNIKGHMASLFRVFKLEEGRYWLRTQSEMAADAQARLAKYIIFSKAKLEDLSPETCGMGLSGPGVKALLQTHFPTLNDWPSQAHASRHGENWALTCLETERYELWGSFNSLQPLLTTLLTEGQMLSSNDWLLADIRAGIPDLRPATCEAFIPQMTNLQALEGVSFQKGCYTGQEIVTRLQHRGQLKRPMFHMAVSCKRTPEAGELLRAAEKDNVGQVVLAAQTQPEEVELLVVALKERAEQEDLYLSSGEKLRLLSLPYELDPKLFESKR
jgi:tRNA-modifying protein YgfZ